MQYYQKINEAEYEFTQNNVNEALRNYEEAFQLYPTAFTKDYINGAIMSVTVKNNDLAKKWISEAIRRGMDQKQLLNHKFLIKKLGRNYLTELYNKVINSQKLLYNPAVHKTIDSLFMIDQDVRNNFDKGTISKNDWRSTDSLISVKLIEIIKEYGHLGESIIGYPGAINKVGLMIAHNSGKFNMNSLKNFVFSGTMLPGAYARVKDLDVLEKNNERYYYYVIYDAVSPTNKSYVQYSSMVKADAYFSSKLPIINERRVKIGLQTVEKMQLFLQKKYRKYRFLIQLFA